jgi:hypothetical protein
MTWWRDFWRKPSSTASHFAWGFVIAAAAVRFGASDLLAVGLALLGGIVWEVVPELCLSAAHKLDWIARPTAILWRARAWDVTPWLLGGFAQAILWWLTKGESL